MKRKIHLIHSGVGGNVLAATLNDATALVELDKIQRTYPTAYKQDIELLEDALNDTWPAMVGTMVVSNFSNGG